MINFDAYQLQRGRSNLFYQKMALDINKKEDYQQIFNGPFI